MKKAYQKPGITEVKLVPGEAVLQFCKDDFTPNPGYSNCWQSPLGCWVRGS